MSVDVQRPKKMLIRSPLLFRSINDYIDNVGQRPNACVFDAYNRQEAAAAVIAAINEAPEVSAWWFAIKDDYLYLVAGCLGEPYQASPAMLADDELEAVRAWHEMQKQLDEEQGDD